MLRQTFLFLWMLLFAVASHAQTDTLPLANDGEKWTQKDSIVNAPSDTALLADTIPISMANAPLQRRLDILLNENTYLNTTGKPVAMVMKRRMAKDLDSLFYLIIGVLFLFAVLRAVYNRYFSTLFTVFFNSSLRQSQLTDQLIQAKLPSLFFNLIFFIATGLYIYLLLQHPASWGNQLNWGLMVACFIAVCSVYLIKFLTLKLVGSITGFYAESNLYIFVVFLINKIVGIFLLPVLVILSFAGPIVASIFTYGSFVMVGVLFLLRYFRSYGLLQHRIKVGRFHFLMYVFAIELLPLLLICKGVHDFVLKNV